MVLQLSMTPINCMSEWSNVSMILASAGTYLPTAVWWRSCPLHHIHTLSLQSAPDTAAWLIISKEGTLNNWKRLSRCRITKKASTCNLSILYKAAVWDSFFRTVGGKPCHDEFHRDVAASHLTHAIYTQRFAIDPFYRSWKPACFHLCLFSETKVHNFSIEAKQVKVLPLCYTEIIQKKPIEIEPSTTKMEAGNQNHPTREEMKAVFAMCRHDQWNSVLNSIRSNPLISTTSMIMDNHITTTILHQAITSKGDTKARARVILEILNTSPSAAGIKNGYGSLALHVLCQRNTKMDSKTKERLMRALVEAYKPALVLEGGVGKRTPLHIIFTDYVSPGITK